MTKKQIEEQERFEFITEILNRKTKFTDEQKEMIERFMYNIITSKVVMNRYSYSMYGNVIENKVIYLNDCIEYLGNKIARRNKDG